MHHTKPKHKMLPEKNMFPHGWSWLFGLSLERMDKNGHQDSPCTDSPNLNSLLRTIPWLEQLNLAAMEPALWSTSLTAWYPSKFWMVEPCYQGTIKSHMEPGYSFVAFVAQKATAKVLLTTRQPILIFQFSGSRNSLPSATRRRDRERSYHVCCRGTYALS